MPSKIWSICSDSLLRGALEQQVLEQVRQPRLVLELVARAGPDPEPERHGSRRRALPPSRSGRPTQASSGGAVASRLSAARLGARTLGSRSRTRPRSPFARSTVPVTRSAAVAVARSTITITRSPVATVGPRARRLGGGDGAQLFLVLALDSGSEASRRPMRPRSRSTSTTLTPTSSPLLSTSSTVAILCPGATLEMCKQAVGALGELDERAERGRLDDLAGELVADLDSLVIELIRATSASPSSRLEA